MNDSHLQRINNQIAFVISNCLANKLNDAIISSNILTVTKVETSNDYSVCKIFVATLINDNTEKQKILSTLAKASGFMRKEIANNVKMRIIPKLVFKLDENTTYSQKIENILKGLNIPPAEEENNETDN